MPYVPDCSATLTLRPKRTQPQSAARAHLKMVLVPTSTA